MIYVGMGTETCPFLVGRRCFAGEILSAQRAGASSPSDEAHPHRRRQAPRPRQPEDLERALDLPVHPPRGREDLPARRRHDAARRGLGVEHHAGACPRPAHGGLSLFRPARDGAGLPLHGRAGRDAAHRHEERRGGAVAALVDPFRRRHRRTMPSSGRWPATMSTTPTSIRCRWKRCDDRSFRLQPRRQDASSSPAPTPASARASRSPSPRPAARSSASAARRWTRRLR